MLNRKKIYFDGFLPSFKFDTRLGRLISTTRRMTDYFYTNQVVHIPGPVTRTPETLYTQFPIPSRLSALPPPPFHVPAIIEALQESSQYGSITQIVPGEADLYCSKYLSKNGGIVLTGDSDLLVHTNGPQGKVAFFKDITTSGNGALKAQIYWPSSIVKDLELPVSHGLSSLAFEMILDTHAHFTTHVTNAKKLKAVLMHASMFSEFQKEYRALDKELPSDASLSSAASLLQGLDPRVSEYVLKFACLADLSGQEKDSQSDSAAHIFLPFLLDTPEQTSAWEMTASVRQLAYGLINLVVPIDQQRNTVYEHKRQKDKSQGRELALPDISEILEACAAINKMLKQLRERLPKLSDQDSWSAVALYHDLRWAHIHVKEPLCTVAQHKMLNGNLSKTSAWDVVQFFAQVQGSYYSFRMLKQIIHLIVAYSSESLAEPVMQLRECLDTLPKLAQLENLSDVASTLRLVGSILPTIQEMLGIRAESVPVVSKGDKKKAGKRKRKQERESSLQNRPRSSNPFDVLAVE